MRSDQLRQKYWDFFVSRGHIKIPPAPLVLENDPTTLFTSSGMQPLIPYLLGEIHPAGRKLVDSQPCFRAEDINEVGDNHHTTFFEMLGNWSLGDYFKKEQLGFIWQFLTSELKFDQEKLYVSVFLGYQSIPRDEETAQIWQELGVKEDKIFFYGADKNWWSRSGSPDQMPEGEIGGPDSEVFYEFTEVEHDPKYGEQCHPNCGCGRFLEIGNSVFIQYQKQKEGSFKMLPQLNVDFGGGLERLTAATLNTNDIFQIDLFQPVIQSIERITDKSYQGEDKSAMQVIADHLKAAVFIVKNGVVPSNKMQGYVLRRLLRRSMVKMRLIKGSLGKPEDFIEIAESILKIYNGLFDINMENDKAQIAAVIKDEVEKFDKTLERGLREIQKIDSIGGKIAFDLYQSYGFPLEVTEELARQRGQVVDKKEFSEEFAKHRELSRNSSAGIFKGGLAGYSETEVKYHTATHLLHQALRDVLGPQVFQKGSNINQERARFDFSYDKKMTDEEIKRVEDLINQKITQDLQVEHKEVAISEARRLNAIGLFDQKYGEVVSLYAIGPEYPVDPNALDLRYRGGYYSLEFCGGPHVSRTGEIGPVRIIKEEAVSAGVRRIRMELLK